MASILPSLNDGSIVCAGRLVDDRDVPGRASYTGIHLWCRAGAEARALHDNPSEWRGYWRSISIELRPIHCRATA